MGYEERGRVLGNDEEWFNIPLVVRNLLHQLNDENERQKTIIEALRREQKSTNEFLKRVSQKQADMEMDATRHYIMAQEDARSVHKDPQQQIQHLRRKVDKVSEQLAQVDKDTITFARNHRENIQRVVEEKCEDMITKLLQVETNARTKQLDDLIRDTAAAHQSLGECFNSSVAGIRVSCEETRQMTFRLTEMTREEISAMKKKCEEGREYDKSLEQANTEFAHKLDLLSKQLARTVSTSEKRFTSTIQAVEKVQQFCEGYVHSRSEVLAQCTREYASALEQHRTASQQMHSRTEETVSQLEKNTDTALQEIRGDLGRIENVRLHACSSASEKALRTAKGAESKVNDIGEELSSLSVELSNHRQSTEKQTEEFRAAINKVVTDNATYFSDLKGALEQVSICNSRHSEVVASQIQDREVLRSALQRFSAALLESAQLRERSDHQLTRLCEVVHNVSRGIEQVEQRLSRELQTTRTLACQTSTEVEPPVKVERSPSPSSGGSQLQQCHLDMLATLSHRLDSIERRVTHNEHTLGESVREAAGRLVLLERGASSRDDVAALLCEVPPMLIEVETMKRRIASIELERASDLRSRASAADRSEHQWRNEIDMCTQMNGTKKEVDELSRVCLGLEQRVGVLSRDHGAVGESASTAAQLASCAEREVHRLGMRVSHLEGAVEGLLAASQTVQRSQQVDWLTMSEPQLRSMIEAECRQQIAPLTADYVKHNQRLDRLEACVEAIPAFEKDLTTLQASLQEQAEHVKQVASCECTRTPLPLDTAKDTTPALAVEVSEMHDALKAVSQTHEGLDARVEVLAAQLQQLRDTASKLAEEADATLVPSLAEDVEQLNAKVDDLVTILTDRLAGLEKSLIEQQRSQQHQRKREEETVEETSFSHPQPHGNTLWHEAMEALSSRIEEIASSLPAADLAHMRDGVAIPRAGEQHACEVCYPRAQLEERLENMWLSVVSLLSQKDDEEAVNQKLQDLHGLMAGEVQTIVAYMREDIDNSLTEKVGVAELQRLLEGAT